MRRERHRPLDFLGSCRHQKLLRSLSRHYMTLIQTLLNLCPHSSIPLYTSNQTHPNARCWIRQSLLLIKNLIVVCLSWFCHLRVLPSVNLYRSCPLVLLLTNRPSLPPPRSLAPTSPPLSSRNATAPPLPPMHLARCAPPGNQWPRPRSLPKSASRMREKTGSAARWRRVTGCVPWICTRSSSRHGQLAGRRCPQSIVVDPVAHLSAVPHGVARAAGREAHPTVAADAEGDMEER
jgi:hypothetical protein